MATTAVQRDTECKDPKSGGLKARITHLFKNDSMSDFTFIIDEQRIPVHKLILSSSSSVFYVMFYGAYSTPSKEIEMNGICYDHFLEFLRFIYTDEACLSWQNVFEVLELSKQYIIPSLSEKCRQFITCKPTVDNVLAVLNRSELLMDKELTNVCLKIIAYKTRNVVNKDSFLDLSLAALEMILALENPKILEVDLFLAVDKWCSHQLNKEPQKNSGKTKRNVIGEAIKHIRFPTMSMQDFSKHCIYSDLLTDQEIKDVMHIISLREKDQKEDVLERVPFPKNPRRGYQQTHRRRDVDED